MDLRTDSDEQRLIETYLEPLTWWVFALVLVFHGFFRVLIHVSSVFVGMSSPEEKYSDPESSEDASSVDGLLQQETSEGDVKRLAKKKLLVACVVSLLFMTGEVIGEVNKHTWNLTEY